jgi:hypothetical protein
MDPKWLYRAGLAVVIVAFVVMIGRVAVLALKPDTARLQQTEAKALGTKPPPAAPATR